jgi:DNA-binding transcriptional MocR family regulator
VSPPPLEQLIACDLLADVDEILGERRAQLRTQRDHIAALLDRHGGWTYRVPAGGLTIWLQLNGTTGAALAARARSRGLALSPGPQFSADRTLTNCLRMPFTATPDVLTRAIGLLTSPPSAGAVLAGHRRRMAKTMPITAPVTTKSTATPK